MAITVRCSSCNQQYQVRDGLAGKSVVCKECGADVRVGASGSGAADEDDVSAGYSLPGETRAASPARPSRKSRGTPVEPVLPRLVSDDSSGDRRRANGAPQALWIYLGAGLLLLVVVVVVVGSVGRSPVSNVNVATVAPLPGGTAPPPVYTPTSAPQPSEAAPVPKNPTAKNQAGSKAAGSKAAGGKAVQEMSSTPDRADGDGADFKIGRGGRSWSVKVDAPGEPFVPDATKKILATIPKNSRGDVIFPDCPSPFVAVGSNNGPREVREVRDIQGNRRVGSVKGTVIANARPALSPDGQHFAVWPAGQSRIGVWSTKSEKPRGMIPVAGNGIPRLLMFAGNERLIAAGEQNELYVWQIPSGLPERALPLPTIKGGLVAGLSPGGRLLALAAESSDKAFLRVYDLAKGYIAGEITLDGFAENPPACHAVAFSPDGTELAALFESESTSNLFAFRATDGGLESHVEVEVSLQELLHAGEWRGGRALEWFPNRQRWLVYGQGVIDRAAGKLVWTLPELESGATQLGHVLDDEHLLVLGMEKQEAALVPLEVGSQ